MQIVIPADVRRRLSLRLRVRRTRNVKMLGTDPNKAAATSGVEIDDPSGQNVIDDPSGQQVQSAG